MLQTPLFLKNNFFVYFSCTFIFQSTRVRFLFRKSTSFEKKISPLEVLNINLMSAAKLKINELLIVGKDERALKVVNNYTDRIEIGDMVMITTNLTRKILESKDNKTTALYMIFQ